MRPCYGNLMTPFLFCFSCDKISLYNSEWPQIQILLPHPSLIHCFSDPIEARTFWNQAECCVSSRRALRMGAKILIPVNFTAI